MPNLIPSQNFIDGGKQGKKPLATAFPSICQHTVNRCQYKSRRVAYTANNVFCFEFKRLSCYRSVHTVLTRKVLSKALAKIHCIRRLIYEVSWEVIIKYNEMKWNEMAQVDRGNITRIFLVFLRWSIPAISPVVVSSVAHCDLYSPAVDPRLRSCFTGTS